MTSSPGPFPTGMDSPVSMDSSTAERPSVTTPSTGIFSPGRTITRSPTSTSSTGTSISTVGPTSSDNTGHAAPDASVASAPSAAAVTASGAVAAPFPPPARA